MDNNEALWNQTTRLHAWKQKEVEGQIWKLRGKVRTAIATRHIDLSLVFDHCGRDKLHIGLKTTYIKMMVWDRL